jgi:hypothetical protein
MWLILVAGITLLPRISGAVRTLPELAVTRTAPSIMVQQYSGAQSTDTPEEAPRADRMTRGK